MNRRIRLLAVLFTAMMLAFPLAVIAAENSIYEGELNTVLQHDMILDEIINAVYAQFQLEITGDTYTIVEGCEGKLWVFPLTDVNNSNRRAYLYYFPEKSTYFVLDISPKSDEPTKSEMRLYKQGSGSTLYLSEDKIGIIPPISEHMKMKALAAGDTDWGACLLKTLGITDLNPNSIPSLVCSDIGTTLTFISLAKNCLTVDPTSWPFCALGVAKLVACNIINCSPLSAPTGVSASNGTYTDKVYITWNSVSGATSYNVYRATSSSGTKSKIGSSTTTSYNDTIAVAGTTYYYWVTAVNSAGESGYSGYGRGYRKASPPSSPTGVSASDGTYTDKVYITWSSVSGATSYNVYRATSSSGTKSKIGSSTTTSYSDTTATVGTTYYYWVAAVNSAGESGYSGYNSGYRKK